MRPLLIAATTAFILLSTQAFTHGGGFDGLGCHHNRKIGGYHCHRGPLARQSFASKEEALGKLPDAQEVPKTTPAPKTVTPTPTRVIAGRASVVDGDTLEILGQRIRMHGIDAPESGQECKADGQKYRCGQKAALALLDKIGQQTVSCEQHDTDMYERAVAVCRVGAEDLGAWMVLEGWALAYRKYSSSYVWAEDAAKEGRKGLWAMQFEQPACYRKPKSRRCPCSFPQCVPQ